MTDQNEEILEEETEEETEEVEEEEVETPSEPDPKPVEPDIPPTAPRNLIATANDDILGITLEWEYEENENIEFKIYINDLFSHALSNDNKIKLSDFVAGEAYKANVSAVDKTTGLESVLSNAVYFEIKAIPGDDNPNNWISVKLDNITVIYQK